MCLGKPNIFHVYALNEFESLYIDCLSNIFKSNKLNFEQSHYFCEVGDRLIPKN